MDDKNKPPGPAGAGARDISDLKARLGLKKGAGGVPAPGGPGAPAPMGGGFPSPVSGGGAVGGIPAPIPAPPGFPSPIAAAPEPAAPSVDPRRDPFATQAPAAPPSAYYNYAPIPGMDDGKPAEQIQKPKPWGSIGVGAIALAALFGLGYSCGGIHWARGNMNRTINDSLKIKDEVDKMAKQLTVINERIAGSADAAKNQPDVQLAADLGSLELKKTDLDKNLFHTNYYFLDDLAINRLFEYYNDSNILYGMIASHAKKTEADKDSIESFLKQGKAGGDKNYGVTLDLTGAIPLAHFAEIGGPLCPKEGETDCSAADLKGFKFRTDTGAQWSTKPVKGPPGTIIIPLQKTPLFATVASGSPDIIAAKDHVRRMAEIRMLTGKLYGEQKELQAALAKASERGKVKEFIIF